MLDAVYKNAQDWLETAKARSKKAWFSKNSKKIADITLHPIILTSYVNTIIEQEVLKKIKTENNAFNYMTKHLPIKAS